MSQYSAQLDWQRQPGETFTDQRYSRRHTLRFDGGVVLPGSSAVASVPLPWSDPGAVDPEEMFIAALSSCHLLWFLSLAAQAGYRVDRYTDEAEGTLARDSRGTLSMTQVTLRPQVQFSGTKTPSLEALQALHHEAHERCYIAQSVLTEVRCEPRA